MSELRAAVLAVLEGMPGSGPLQPPGRQAGEAGPCSAPGCYVLQWRYGVHGSPYCPVHRHLARVGQWKPVSLNRTETSTVMLPAQPCPELLLPKNAAKMIRVAEAQGYQAKATYAIGEKLGGVSMAALKVVRTVLVQAFRGNSYVWALWEGSMDSKTMGFEYAYRWRPYGLPDKMTSTELLRGGWDAEASEAA